MNSSSHRLEEERRQQADLLKQIALLQAQINVYPETTSEVSKSSKSPKRKYSEPTLLAPATPSPKKKRKVNHDSHHKGFSGALFSSSSGHDVLKRGSRANRELNARVALPLPVAPSNVLSNLAALNGRPVDTSTEAITRSHAFTERPQPPPTNDHVDVLAPKRDARLALIEELEPGPYDHTPPHDDPEFQRLEPNSGIRLSSRVLPHSDLQDHLSGRFYLAPSRLYSAIRLLPDKQGYDVPVLGDWITIAVVAERGPLKFTRAPVAIGMEEGDKKPDTKGQAKHKPESNKLTGKKYVNMKLIDFGARSKSSSSATGGKDVIRGDAFLSLLLFESDSFDLVTKEDGEKAQKLYKGGSRGAFESMAKLKEGDVIALLNPKILKPFQRSSDTPHPVNNILALTPESAASIAVIGRAQDLGMCTVLKRDGKPCGSWCDKRVSDICEYHVTSAVQRQRAGRAEFSIGTSGMSASSAPKRKPTYDPARQWGLKPEDSSLSNSGATYVVSGHVVSGSGADPRALFVAESMGREGQAKAKRKLKDSDRALKSLLDKDKQGMRAVVMAREVGLEQKKAKEGDRRRKGEDPQQSAKSESKKKFLVEDDLQPGSRAKSAYSAGVIKQLGFDPTAKAGQRRSDDFAMQKKIEALEAVRCARKDIILGPRPGPKIRSGVFAPPKENAPNSISNADLPDKDSSDDEMPAQVLETRVEEERMIDLDDI